MNSKEKTLVIGAGQVGQGLAEVLKKKYEVEVYDKTSCRKFPEGKFDVIHICFPYSENFDTDVFDYLEKLNPNLCIIHSSIPPDCKCVYDKRVVYSPVRGVHPNLADGIQTFVKIVASESEESLKMAEEYLGCVGIATARYGVKEAIYAKLLYTTYYGACIAFADYVNKICKAENLDFKKVYEHWNKTYNYGYQQLGKENVVRPVLYPPKSIIGGHCQRENSLILEEFHDSPFLDMIQDLSLTKK